MDNHIGLRSAAILTNRQPLLRRRAVNHVVQHLIAGLHGIPADEELCPPAVVEQHVAVEHEILGEGRARAVDMNPKAVGIENDVVSEHLGVGGLIVGVDAVRGAAGIMIVVAVVVQQAPVDF